MTFIIEHSGLAQHARNVPNAKSEGLLLHLVLHLKDESFMFIRVQDFKHFQLDSLQFSPNMKQHFIVFYVPFAFFK